MSLGRLLYPNDSPGQRKRSMRALGLGLVLGAVAAGIVALALYLIYTQGKP